MAQDGTPVSGRIQVEPLMKDMNGGGNGNDIVSDKKCFHATGNQ